jgi:transcriptional regulator with XRE-family HTH domain
MKRTRSYLPQTTQATKVLGLEIASMRRGRRMTATDLSERAGITTDTLRKAERGDPTVGIGTVFELAGLVGIDLFGVSPADLPPLVRRGEDRLALLPSRVRTSERTPLDNDF